jgi:hypothetical protein
MTSGASRLLSRGNKPCRKGREPDAPVESSAMVCRCVCLDVASKTNEHGCCQGMRRRIDGKPPQFRPD